jgi:hypothetical protein
MQSYDPRMEQYPLLISYPRSGSNWLNCVLELYFNRPRLRAGPVTFLANRDQRTDYMWFHDHDIFSDLKVGHNDIIYLYRNPSNVIFSLLMAEHKDSFYTNEMNKLVTTQIGRLKTNLQKYLPMVQTSVNYEKLKGQLSNVLYYDEFNKIIQFFIKADVDRNKLDNILQRVSKHEIIDKETDKKYFNKTLLSIKYEQMRDDFIETFDKRIQEQIIVGELERYFYGTI